MPERDPVFRGWNNRNEPGYWSVNSESGQATLPRGSVDMRYRFLYLTQFLGYYEAAFLSEGLFYLDKVDVNTAETLMFLMKGVPVFKPSYRADNPYRAYEEELTRSGAGFTGKLTERELLRLMEMLKALHTQQQLLSEKAQNVTVNIKTPEELASLELMCERHPHVGEKEIAIEVTLDELALLTETALDSFRLVLILAHRKNLSEYDLSKVQEIKFVGTAICSSPAMEPLATAGRVTKVTLENVRFRGRDFDVFDGKDHSVEASFYSAIYGLPHLNELSIKSKNRETLPGLIEWLKSNETLRTLKLDNTFPSSVRGQHEFNRCMAASNHTLTTCVFDGVPLDYNYLRRNRRIEELSAKHTELLSAMAHISEALSDEELSSEDFISLIRDHFRLKSSICMAVNELCEYVYPSPVEARTIARNYGEQKTKMYKRLPDFLGKAKEEEELELLFKLCEETFDSDKEHLELRAKCRHACIRNLTRIFQKEQNYSKIVRVFEILEEEGSSLENDLVSDLLRFISEAVNADDQPSPSSWSHVCKRIKEASNLSFMHQRMFMVYARLGLINSFLAYKVYPFKGLIWLNELKNLGDMGEFDIDIVSLKKRVNNRLFYYCENEAEVMSDENVTKFIKVLLSVEDDSECLRGAKKALGCFLSRSIEINLSDVNISLSHAQDWLAEAQTTEVIVLENISFEYDEAENLFFQAIFSLPNLKELSIKSDHASRRLLPALIEWLKENKSLKRLEVKFKVIPETKFLDSFKKAIEECNLTLEAFVINGDGFCWECLERNRQAAELKSEYEVFTQAMNTISNRVSNEPLSVGEFISRVCTHFQFDSETFKAVRHLDRFIYPTPNEAKENLERYGMLRVRVYKDFIGFFEAADSIETLKLLEPHLGKISATEEDGPHILSCYHSYFAAMFRLMHAKKDYPMLPGFFNLMLLKECGLAAKVLGSIQRFVLEAATADVSLPADAWEEILLKIKSNPRLFIIDESPLITYSHLGFINALLALQPTFENMKVLIDRFTLVLRQSNRGNLNINLDQLAERMVSYIISYCELVPGKILDEQIPRLIAELTSVKEHSEFFERAQRALLHLHKRSIVMKINVERENKRLEEHWETLKSFSKEIESAQTYSELLGGIKSFISAHAKRGRIVSYKTRLYPFCKQLEEILGELALCRVSGGVSGAEDSSVSTAVISASLGAENDAVMAKTKRLEASSDEKETLAPELEAANPLEDRLSLLVARMGEVGYASIEAFYAAYKIEPPSGVICPITGCLMQCPVIAVVADAAKRKYALTYEEAAIKAALVLPSVEKNEEGLLLDPTSKLPLTGELVFDRSMETLSTVYLDVLERQIVTLEEGIKLMKEFDSAAPPPPSAPPIEVPASAPVLEDRKKVLDM
jgi:hypothetical protein